MQEMQLNYLNLFNYLCKYVLQTLMYHMYEGGLTTTKHKVKAISLSTKGI